MTCIFGNSDIAIGLGLSNLIAAFAFFVLMIPTTSHAAWDHDPQHRWAFVRRQVYLLCVFGFFATAVLLLDPRLASPQVALITAMMPGLALFFFLIARKLGVTDQDNWRGFHRDH